MHNDLHIHRFQARHRVPDAAGRQLAQDAQTQLLDGELEAALARPQQKWHYAQDSDLATLAAAYAEDGNFEKAIEWSSKGVEIGKKGKHEQLEELEEELQSYKDGKPWREKQEVQENAVPILSPEDLIET